MIDSHCHLADEAFHLDLAAVVARADVGSGVVDTDGRPLARPDRDDVARS